MTKSIVFAALLTIFASATVHAQPGGQTLKPDAKTEQELRTLRRELMDSLKRGDRAVLERILADGFMFIHSTGKVETRDEYIDRAVANAKRAEGRDFEFSEEQIRVYEERTAVWTTRSTRRTRGEGSEFSFRGTDVIVKIGGRWQWVSVHSTRLPEPENK
ncbi:MAG TPA: nuclear transport factor 2 family protein [Thermoanaerobaculia bacterium]|nr:nuclear transport factor 2 family protein [Thermoanaerobaculia bacterium]